jgi:hypothetical protein
MSDPDSPGSPADPDSPGTPADPDFSETPSGTSADSPSVPAGSAVPVPVHVHVHLAVTGAFPLRVADVLFTGDGVVIPEYEYLTPLFGVALSGVDGAGTTARERYRDSGVTGLVELAERVRRLPYDEVETIRVYHSRVGRPKLAVVPRSGPPYAYRVHAPIDVDALVDALRSLGDRRGFAVERHAKVGYSPVASVRRFVSDR